MTISLLVADDHHVVRLGLRNVLEGSGIVVTDEATTGEEVLKKVAENKPDAVLLDVRMPGGDGLHILGRLKLDYPELPIVLFSTYDNPTYVARAVALGARIVVLDEPDDRLDRAVLGAYLNLRRRRRV